MLKQIMRKFKQKRDPIGFARSQGVTVGEHCRLLSFGFGTEPWLITLGDHVLISGNVSFLTHDGSTWVFREQENYKNVVKYGAINIGDNCFVGYGSIILPNVTIGENSIVDAGSVVTKDVPSGSVVAGVPAKIVCTTEEYAEKCKRNTPPYDVDAYKTDKRSEVLKMLGLDKK